MKVWNETFLSIGLYSYTPAPYISTNITGAICARADASFALPQAGAIGASVLASATGAPEAAPASGIIPGNWILFRKSPTTC